MLNKMMFMTICLLAVKTVLTMPMAEETLQNRSQEVLITKNPILDENITEEISKIEKRAIFIIEIDPEVVNGTEIEPEEEIETEIEPEVEVGTKIEPEVEVGTKIEPEVEVGTEIEPEVENSTESVEEIVKRAVITDDKEKNETKSGPIVAGWYRTHILPETTTEDETERELREDFAALRHDQILIWRDGPTNEE